jgi:AraC-like DNA-binding protein
MTFCANPSPPDLPNKPVETSGEAARVPTLTARSIAKIADSVARFGNADRLLRTVGLDRQAVVDPDIRIPYTDMMMLSERASSMTKDAAFGLHVGERVPESEYGLIGNLMLSSFSLREALECLVRYLPIWTNGGVFKLGIEGNVAHFQWEYARVSLPDPRHDCEMSMATLMRLNRFTAIERWWPKEVWFQPARPRDTSEHARIFRAPVRFGMPANALLLERRVLDLALKTGQHASHRVMKSTAEQLLPEARHDVSVSRSAATFIRQNMGKGPIELAWVARALGLSRRGFQRRLQQESTSYRDLTQEARRDLSEYLLLETGITSTAAADALGYSEHSVFHRAFQKWHGKAPGDYRHSSAERVVPD